MTAQSYKEMSKSVAAKLTEYDARVLRSVERACSKHDGYMARGVAEQGAIARLRKRGLVALAAEYGLCGECDMPFNRCAQGPCEGPVYGLTLLGCYATDSDVSPVREEGVP